jgi:hypothetical protein
MNAQRFQQIQTDVRRTIGRPALALGLGLSLLVAALAGQHYAAPRIAGVPASEQRHTVAAAPGWLGATLMGSAYNGDTKLATRPIVPSSARAWPGATLMGSTYNGQASGSLNRPVTATSRDWPGATLMGSAYDGQSAHLIRPATLATGWPGATPMGSAYNGQ